MALGVVNAQSGTLNGVGNASPGNISGVTNAQPGKISGVVNAQPGSISGVINANQVAQNQSYINTATAQNNDSSAATRALLQQIAGLQNQIASKPLAPVLDYNAIRANATAAASANVNPLYTQKLNEYLQNEAAVTAQQQQGNQLEIQGAQAALANTQSQNTQAQQFAGQNTANVIGNINTQAQNREQNAGNAFDTNRAQLESSIGQSHLTGSGLGEQQIWHARNAANIQETQAKSQDTFNTNQQLLNEGNTFAQIAQSGKYAQTQEGQTESKANLNLNSYLQQAAYNEQQYREQNEQDKQAAILSQASQNAGQQVANFIQSFKNNPALYSAAQQAYGGLMS